MQRDSKRQKVIGKLTLHSRGFGFVTPTSVEMEDIFIPSGKLKGAIDGDIVEVSLGERSKKGYEGEILQVTERGRKRLVGSVIDKLDSGDYLLFASSCGEVREIVLKKEKGKKFDIGDRLLVNVKKVSEERIECTLHEFLGSIEDATLDTKIAIEAHEIRHEFPKEVIQEAKQFPLDLPITTDRKDLTSWDVVTIDPKNAKDFDDALSLKKDKKGHYHLGVHIADVSYFVTPNSHLDREAFKRGNSTYFVDGVVPMLPEELSNELCSLKPYVNRYTLSVLVEFDQEGKCLSYEIVRSIINSKKRFTYEEAKEVLDSQPSHPFYPLLSLFVELAKILRGKKRARGSVDLAMPEVRLVMGKEGIPIGQEVLEYDITHQLVEEFMLMANEIVATHLIKEGKEAIFRVHQEPEEATLAEFFSYARLLGFRLPPEPSAKDLVDLFEMAQKSPLLEQLAIRFIRSMKLAIYSEVNVGHFGLALENYTHFTSPIRRYSDLVVHRLLFEPDYYPNHKMVAAWCTEQERRSFKAEMSVLKLKKIRYLDQLTEKDPTLTFQATLTNIKPVGITFDLDFIGFEGFIHISQIGEDYFVYYPETGVLEGERTKERFRIGQRIEVCLETVDLVFQEATWFIKRKLN